MDEINLVQSWSRYNAKLQTLKQTLGLPSIQESELALHKPCLVFAADKSKTLLCGKKCLTGAMLQKEVQKFYGPDAVDTLMNSYNEVSSSRGAAAPPRQEIIDNVLVRRSLVRQEKKKHNDDTIRKLNENKKQMKAKLKALEIHNNSFGKGRSYVLPHQTPHTVKHQADPRKEYETAKLYGMTQDSEKDELLLDEVVKEIMQSYVTYAPENMDPAISQQRYTKVMSELCTDRGVLLVAEEIVLEMTLEMTQQLVADVVIRVALSSEFDSQFYSAQVKEFLKKLNPLHF